MPPSIAPRGSNVPPTIDAATEVDEASGGGPVSGATLGYGSAIRRSKVFEANDEADVISLP